MSTIRVKICGITRLADALAAVRLGADALGFNFWPGSKRHCDPELARAIVEELPPFVTTVGVFVNQPRAEVVRTSARTGMRVIQLHGEENPQFCTGLPLPVIKALAVSDSSVLATLASYTVNAFLFDAPARSLGNLGQGSFGGSGKTFDWELLRESSDGRPFLLAGGLKPENVKQAIERARPYAVDVASGVEKKPGIKDEAKMAQFIHAVREAKL